jgi:hypothetical protein
LITVQVAVTRPADARSGAYYPIRYLTCDLWWSKTGISDQDVYRAMSHLKMLARIF